MDFPKDPKPSDAEMVEAYVQTAAKVLGRYRVVSSLIGFINLFDCVFYVSGLIMLC